MATETLELEEMQKMLEVFDASVPEEFEVEVMAGQLAGLLANYKQTEVARKAARHAEDHKRAEELSKAVLGLKHNIALIQYSYPKAKKIAEEIMKVKVMQAEQERGKYLEE